MKSGIYQIMNKTNYCMYIGSAVDFKKRWNEHKTSLRRNNHHCLYLQRAWNKDGENSFEFSEIEFVDREDLISKEQYYLDLLKPEYNISKIAGSQLGIKRSLETIKKMSEVRMGKKRKPFSDEHRLNISKSHAGKKFSDEHKRKLSLSKTGEKNNRYGIRQSEETINKRRETNKRKSH